MSRAPALQKHRPSTSFEVGLTQDQLDSFRDKGFVTIERITTDEELEWIGELYDGLFAEKQGAFKGGYFDLSRPYESPGEDLLPQVLSPETRFPELLQTTFWRNGRKLAAQLLGVAADDLKSWGHMIRKPARIGEQLPWHQDEAYWDPAFDYRALGCWMPLDVATIESGCMSMIPGSHRGGILPHRHIGDDPAVHGLECQPDPADIARAAPLPTPAGGAVLHTCRTLHSSGPNVSERPRRAYANEWQTAPVARATPHLRPWVAEGKKAFNAREVKAT